MCAALGRQKQRTKYLGRLRVLIPHGKNLLDTWHFREFHLSLSALQRDLRSAAVCSLHRTARAWARRGRGPGGCGGGGRPEARSGGPGGGGGVRIRRTGAALGRSPSSSARASNVSPVPAAPAAAAARRFGEDTAPPPPSFPSCGHYREEPALGPAKAARQAARDGARLTLARAAPDCCAPPAPEPPGAPAQLPFVLLNYHRVLARRGPLGGAAPGAPALACGPRRPRGGGRRAAAPAPRPRRRLAARRAAAALPGRLGHHHQRQVTSRWAARREKP